MRVMVLIKSNDRTEAGFMPGEDVLADMMEYNLQLAKAGLLLAGDGLQPSAKGARVVWSQTNETTVVAGPFPLAEELVAGYWLWQVDSIEQAVAWARRCPNPVGWGGVVEIREVFEADDWGEAMTPGLREKAEQLFAESAKRQ